MNRRFKQNQDIFKALSLFSPIQFSLISKRYTNAHDLKPDILPFCENYDIDAVECAKELFSFASTFRKVKSNDLDDKSSHFEIEETYECELGEIDDRDTADGTGALSTNSNPSYHDTL